MWIMWIKITIWLTVSQIDKFFREGIEFTFYNSSYLSRNKEGYTYLIFYQIMDTVSTFTVQYFIL